jgi:hypothetical protein
MSLVTVPGSFVTAGAMRRGSILDGGSALVGVGVRDVVDAAVVVVVVIPVIGLLLLALILIITGCGPPN